MRLRLTTALVIMCSFGLISAAAAQAEARYYYQGSVGAYGAVSGTPRSNLYFAGGYTGGGWEYCVGLQTGSTYEGVANLAYGACGSGTSVTSSFPSSSGRAVIANGYHAQTIWGEERW